MGAGNDKMNNVDEVEEMEENLSKINLSRACVVILKTSVAFTCLRKIFTKAPILDHFNPECHIRIKTYASGFAIGEIFSQLISRYVIHTNPDLSASKIGQ